MTQQNTVSTIRAALSKMADGNLPESATGLLDALGYHSNRLLEGQTGSVGDFIAAFRADNPDTLAEKDFRENAAEARVLFQFTDTEIAATGQRMPLDAGVFTDGNARSFLFAAVELTGDTYPRGRYVAFTREINKRFNRVPAVVIFRTSTGRVTLAFVNRRPSKIRSDRQVLGRVSLIREIDLVLPHRAHLDILAELSLQERLGWMDSHGKPRNFDGLLEAWLDALDTEELNRRFYRDLFQWFERAVQSAKFPTGEARTLPAEEHIIRLITRLMFVWFIKEKGLVSEDLFIKNKVCQLLKDYDPDGGDSYYRAVLQNLFFATLNTEIGHRGFSSENNDTHRDFSRYRYRQEIGDEDALLVLLDQTPFINGGLFDCLDSLDATGKGGYRIDCFSDNRAHSRLLSIPNRLFFSNDDRQPGLIDLFDRYKFTVEENTPAEQEVALDPELLGKVFENLLAAYNPETRENVRKQTGSYYTPRPVVDFMVDEALVAALAQRAAPADGDIDFWQERLRYLLDYADADAGELFAPVEREDLVRTIARLKTLDPAAGSGAFPMGILHKLTLALRRLDPSNELWERVQRDEAANRSASAYRNVGDDQQRREALAEIESTFRRYRDSDFGRKLYLIQNSIYGVDIQPVATQIAKLRFFISLAIEQESSPDPADNYGIRPLPNLETRFVAANTLLALEKPAQLALGQTDEVQRLESELAANRERYFHANNRQAKLACRDRDKELRRELAAALEFAGFPAASADQVASWDAFDQNAKPAEWFDSEYMFDVPDGFDIMIGNPPYRQVRKGMYSATQFPYSEGRDKGKQNLYKLFVEQSYNLCKNDGLATLIVQKSLMCDLSSAWTRRLLLERTRLRHIIEFPERARSREAQVFNSVTQGTCIYQFHKATPDAEPIKISVGNDTQTITALRFAEIHVKTIVDLWPDLRCLPYIKEGDVAILQKIASKNGTKSLKHYVASIVQGDLNLATHKTKFSERQTPVHLMRGEHVSRFVIRYDATTEYCEVGFRADKVGANGRETFLISQEVMNQQAARRLNFAMTTKSTERFLWGHTVNKTQLKNQGFSKAFVALLNSKFLDWFFRITSSNNHVQGYELEQLPIAPMMDADRERLSKLADRVMQAKSANPAADISEAEAEIDRLVFGLYGLTEAEIAAVEGKPEFRVVPNRGGLATGVTPDNLKDIIQDLEDEKLLEKLGQ